MKRIVFVLVMASQVPMLAWMGGWEFTRGESGFLTYFFTVSAMGVAWMFYPLLSEGTEP